MTIKLVALDVDGTLLDDQHRISEPNRRAILQAAEQGVKIVLCTGRGAMSTQPVMELLGLQGVMITQNGASVMDTDGKILYEDTFTVGQIASLIEYCRERGVHYDLSTSERMLLDRMPEKAKKMYEDYFATPEMVEDVLQVTDPLVKFCMFGEKELIDEVEEHWANKQHELRFIRSGDFFVDVIGADVTKGKALGKLAEIWGIDRSEVLAMGNYFNDIEMLRYAGIGIAVANSPEEVKEAADEVTVSNNEDAVHAALTKYVL